MATSEQGTGISTEQRQDAKETSRLEAFSDGVFAIAITLLVLDIRVPAHLDIGPAALGQVAADWPEYLAYVLGFVTILIMWANHHLIFQLIWRTTQLFLIMNGLLLMTITFLNFPTALLAASLQRGDPAVAALIYNGTCLLIAVLYQAVWFYAARGDRLLDSGANQVLVRAISRQYRFGPLFYLVAFAAAFLSAGLSIAIDLAIALYFALSGTVHLGRRRDHDRKPAGTFAA